MSSLPTFSSPLEIKGLPNIANSCYLNSSLQLCKLISGFNFKDDSNEQNSFVRDIQSLFTSENHQDEVNKYIKLYSFIAQNLQYQVGVQQDSCEVLQFIIDKFVDLFYNRDLLESVFNQIVRCINCSNIRICTEQKETMLISHELNNNPNDEIDFEQFISNITSNQNVETINTECNCDNPKGQVQTIIKNLPSFLFIKVGRCNIDTTKNYKKLKFTDEFEIEYPFNLERFINNKDNTKIIKRYKLMGIIIHTGDSSLSGHYTVIIKNNNEWFHCDDLSVNQIDIYSNLEHLQKNCSVLLYHSN